MVAGAIEGEELSIVEVTGGETKIQNSEAHDWSGAGQLWWIDGKPGDRLILEIPVKEAGKYRVTADLTKAIDYGIVCMKLAGQTTKSLDRYNVGVANDALELGTFDLEKGINRLEVEIVGANEKAKNRHMFGLDYLKLEKAE